MSKLGPVNSITLSNKTSNSLNLTMSPWSIFLSCLVDSIFTLEQGVASNPGVEIDMTDDGLFLFAGGSSEGIMITDENQSRLTLAGPHPSDYLLRGLEIEWPTSRDSDPTLLHKDDMRILRVALTDSRPESSGIISESNAGRREIAPPMKRVAFAADNIGTRATLVIFHDDCIVMQGEDIESIAI